MNHFIILLCLASAPLIFTAEQSYTVPDYKKIVAGLHGRNNHLLDTISALKTVVRQDNNWHCYLENPFNAGKVIKHICNLYELTPLTHVALFLGTRGCLAWCKQTVQNNTWELKSISYLLELECSKPRADIALIASLLRLDIQFSPHCALPCAAEKGNFSLVKLLLDHRVNVDDKDVFGCTALMHAANNKFDDIVALLLMRGANVNTVNKDQKNALMIAANQCHLSIVHLLVSAGADLCAYDKDHKTALWYAQEASPRHAEKSICIVELLKKKAANS